MEQQRTQFANCTALYAEDNAINQELIREMLELMNLDVDVVDDGQEAMELYQNNDYDVVFLDIQMPKKDGYEVAKLIRRMDKTQPVIIAITANTQQGDKEQCLEVGMDDYIPKPVELHHLEEALKKYFPDKAS